MSSDDPAIRFDDGKNPLALRTIGEVAAALGIRQHVLRYWEEQFPMLRPVKRRGGRRYYRPEDVQLVARIDRLLHREGYTIKGASKVLDADASEPDPAPAIVEQQDITTQLRAMRDGIVPLADPQVISQLRRIRDRLAMALTTV